MVSFKTGGLRLLQAAALISSVTARCTPCSASDKLLLLLRAQGEAELAPFCAAFLGAPASTVEVTVTPTTVVSVTSTVVVTEVSTFYEEVVTISVPATVTAPATVAASTPEYTMEKKAKRTVDYPEWLASTYSPERVSSACQCLSIPAASEATVTATATAEAVTLTDDATVTETITNTVTTDIGVVTQTVWTTVVPTPTPSTVAQRAIISVHHKGTGALVGYVYMSSGPAITTDRTLAAVVKFDMPAGATTASKLRLLVEGYSPSALSFQCPVNLELQNYYGSMTLNGNPTPPGSRPVPAASFAYETDIWTVNTETKMLGWEWIGNDGAVYSSLALYRVGGRMYPVGNLVPFNTAFAAVSAANKYEVVLKYVLV